MKYFVHIKPHGSDRYTLEFVERENVVRIVEAYFNGDASFIIEGQKYPFSDVKILKIFKCKIRPDQEKPFLKSLAKEGRYRGLFRTYLDVEEMREMDTVFEDETKFFVGNESYGSKKKSVVLLPTDSFISIARIEELKKSSILGYDLSKVVRLCEEINSSYAIGNFFAVGMLCRALKDHIPPLFASGGQVTFQDVIDAKGLEKSDREALKILAQNKHIQDGFIHSQIKRRESLANSSTVEIRSQIDVLLRLIVEKGE